MRSTLTHRRRVVWAFFFFLTMTSSIIYAQTGESCEEAITITPGTYTVDTLVGTGGIYGGAAAAKWYYIEPDIDGILSVSSCGQGVDTRLFLLPGICGENSSIARGDDDCISSGTRKTAAKFDAFVKKAKGYFILWDSPWSKEGFEFTVSLVPPPMVNITFKVDMQYVNTSAFGIGLATNANAWSPTTNTLTEEASDTWSTTLSLQAGDTLLYKFVNGNTMLSAETVPLTCGIPDGNGNFVRRFIVPATDMVLDAVCFGKCADCPAMECTDAQIVLCDNFDNYSIGKLTPYSAFWETWSGVGGSGEDPLLSTEQSVSGENSLKIENGSGAQSQNDVLFKLGDKKNGNYELRWKMYIPDGKQAYYDIQKFQDIPGGPENDGAAFQVQFFADNIGVMNVGLADSVSFSFPADTWFDVVHKIDIKNNLIELFINNTSIYSWPFNYQATNVIGAKQLGAVHFSSGIDHVFYIDDIELEALDNIITGPVSNTVFTLDMKSLIDAGGTVADKVYLAGSFNNWDTKATPMSNTSGNLWTITMLLPQGEKINYKFINGDTFEEVPVSCGYATQNQSLGFTRELVVGESTTVIDLTCFSACPGSCEIVSSTKNKELVADLKLYPNPTTGTIYLDYNFENPKDVSIKIFNAIGQEFSVRQLKKAQSGTISFEMENLPAGIYFLNINDGNLQTSRKIILRK